jgi:hypothetical protein
VESNREIILRLLKEGATDDELRQWLPVGVTVEMVRELIEHKKRPEPERLSRFQREWPL